MQGIDRIREAVSIALDQLRANKFRSALTILGIVIGVATVMTMGAAVAGIRGTAMKGIQAAGPENFMVARYNYLEIQLTEDGPRWWDNPAVTAEEARRLAELSGVQTTIVDIDHSASLQGPTGGPIDIHVSGNGLGWDEFRPGTFVAGHNFLASDLASSHPVAVFNDVLAQKVFGALDPIGRTVKLNGRPFTVIGVFKRDANLFGEDDANVAWVPYTAVLKHLKAWDGMLTAMVVTADQASQQEAIDQVVGAMRAMRGLRPAEPNNFAVIRQEQILETFNKITGVFFIVMLALSSVALLVGGVGVIAIMMISVTERTREIGVRKALGARRREILWQFLFEAATLTVAGCVAGMLLGGAAAWVIQAVTPIPAAVQFSSVIAALLMAAVAGILFGLFPAWRASRMDPVVALRYE